MIQPLDLFNINFYKKSPFYGSYKGMHYRIKKEEKEDQVHFEVITWPGPYNFETTDDALKVSALFPFTPEGLLEVCDYLNEFHASNFVKTY